jgi:hypothetical protein
MMKEPKRTHKREVLTTKKYINRRSRVMVWENNPTRLTELKAGILSLIVLPIIFVLQMQI